MQNFAHSNIDRYLQTRHGVSLGDQLPGCEPPCTLLDLVARYIRHIARYLYSRYRSCFALLLNAQAFSDTHARAFPDTHTRAFSDTQTRAFSDTQTPAFFHSFFRLIEKGDFEHDAIYRADSGRQALLESALLGTFVNIKKRDGDDEEENDEGETITYANTIRTLQLHYASTILTL
jgi:hypothetical protein